MYVILPVAVCTSPRCVYLFPSLNQDTISPRSKFDGMNDAGVITYPRLISSSGVYSLTAHPHCVSNSIIAAPSSASPGTLYASVFTISDSGVFPLASLPDIFDILTGETHGTLGIVSLLMKPSFFS